MGVATDIQNAIQTITEQSIANASFDKTRRGVIKSVNIDTQTYTVLIDGVTYYNVKPLSGTSVRTGDVVNVIYPTNNPSQMMISGITDMTQDEIEDFIDSINQTGRTICPYSVGDIYETIHSTNPSTKWEGTTWSADIIEKDYVVEEGQSDIWRYTKWASGLAMIYGRYTASSGTFASWGSLYYRTITLDKAFPFTITEPRVQVSNSSSNWLIPAGVSFTTSKFTDITVVKASSANEGTSIDIIVNGLWKTYSAPLTIYKWRRLS